MSTNSEETPEAYEKVQENRSLFLLFLVICDQPAFAKKVSRVPLVDLIGSLARALFSFLVNSQEAQN